MKINLYRNLCFGVLLSTLLHCQANGAILPSGMPADAQTSIGYDPLTGEVYIDAPLGTDLTSFRVESAGAVLTGDSAMNLILPPGGFDVDEDDVIFKSTIGSSFGSLSFGNVAQTGLSESFLLNDWTVTGSLDGGGGLGDVDLIYGVPVPEPASATLAVLLVSFAFYRFHCSSCADGNPGA